MAVDPAFGGVSIGEPIDKTRPILKNEDGTFSTGSERGNEIDPAFGGVPQEFQEAPEIKNFFERSAEDVNKRRDEFSQVIQAYKEGKANPADIYIQYVGKALAGSVLDIIGEGVVSAGRGLSLIIPDYIEDPIKNKAKEAWSNLTQTEAGEKAIEAIEGGAKKYKEFKEEFPQQANNLESLVNVSLLMAPVKTKAKAEPSLFGKTATKIQKAAEKQVLKKRSSFIKNLVTPKDTAKVRLEQVARTTEKGIGPLMKSVIKPSPRELDIAKEVSKISGVSPKNSIQGNYIKIDKANSFIARKLESDVAKSNAKISLQEATSAIDDAITKLVSENPVITGNAELVATKLANKARQFVSMNEPTPLGILKARKQFDAFIRSQKRNAFDPNLENVLSVSTRSVRGAMNDLVDVKVKTTAVKAELKRQNLLFDALENIGPKAADEANTAIGRSIQNIAKILPFRSKFVNEAGAVVGLGIVGASATFAPLFAGGLAATVITSAGGKLIAGPGFKKGAAKLIKGIDRALLSSKNPSMIKQLRADRALIVELIKSVEIDENENPIGGNEE